MNVAGDSVWKPIDTTGHTLYYIVFIILNNKQFDGIQLLLEGEGVSAAA
jgi:hypothetical protein